MAESNRITPARERMPQPWPPDTAPDQLATGGSMSGQVTPSEGDYMTGDRDAETEGAARRQPTVLLAAIGLLMTLAAGFLAVGTRGLMVVILATGGGTFWGCARMWQYATASDRGHLALSDRVTAWLSFKFGKRPSDALLAYCAEHAATASLRHEAARLLAKRPTPQRGGFSDG